MTNLDVRNQVANWVENLEVSKQRTGYFSCIKRNKRAKKLQLQLFGDLEELLRNKHIVHLRFKGFKVDIAVIKI